jgi:hypothetical protein
MEQILMKPIEVMIYIKKGSMPFFLDRSTYWIFRQVLLKSINHF